MIFEDDMYVPAYVPPFEHQLMPITATSSRPRLLGYPSSTTP
jgi:hypothetical protein